MREDAARFVDFYVVSADNVVGWSGQKLPGLNFCPSPPLAVCMNNISPENLLNDTTHEVGFSQ